MSASPQDRKPRRITASTIKTWILVTVVAALTWVWAEGESLRSVTVSAKVTFEDTAGYAVRVRTDGWADRISVQLEGSTAVLEQAQELLAEGVAFQPGATGLLAETGVRSIQTADLLGGVRALRDLGVTVVSAEPSSLNVEVVQLAERELPVVLQAEGVVWAGPQEWTPKQAIVRGPAELIRGFDPASGSVRIVLDRNEIARLSDSEKRTVAGRLEPPPSLRGAARRLGLEDTLTVLSGAASPQVEGQLSRRVASAAIARTPVWVASPGLDTRAWVIEQDPLEVAGLMVEGPPSALARVRGAEAAAGPNTPSVERDLVVVVIVTLTPEDLREGVRQKLGRAVIVPAEMLAPVPPDGAPDFDPAALSAPPWREAAGSVKVAREFEFVPVTLRIRAAGGPAETPAQPGQDPES